MVPIGAIAILPATAPGLWRIHLWPLSAFVGRAYIAAMSLRAGDYRPRNAEHTVLSRVIDEHLDVFLETARHHADGAPLPAFVEREFRDFLTCGVGRRVRPRVPVRQWRAHASGPAPCW